MISTLSATTRQLEVDFAAEQRARSRAKADCAGRERAAQESGAALEEVCLELRRVQVRVSLCCAVLSTERQRLWRPSDHARTCTDVESQVLARVCFGVFLKDNSAVFGISEHACAGAPGLQGELRKQTGATAFHRKFAGELSMLLEDARGALAEMHLTVSALVADRLRGGNSDGGIRASSNGTGGSFVGDAASAMHHAATAGVAEKALARAVASHGSLPLGRRRTARGVQTAHCELWALSAGPWGRDQLRSEMHAVLAGQAPPDISLRDFAAAAAPGSDVSSSRHRGSAAVYDGSAASARKDADAASADWALRRAPSLAATARVVQEVHAAKVAADAAARAARKQPLSLCAILGHHIIHVV